ncbi:hypothetical protein LEP1GSC103_2807 [Leptospira borgpetersenii serovar Javanica str. UI 09931]|uniref:Uncharacterized protein n=2 Tax=Leptospira borgpetersenii TaxID=174 RepID=A0AAV3JCE4_LEPBO|nr:hypothetical protein LEP1GSC101_3150 [Leptospira borgpetersenii str. UI 09149]EMN13607.1 hypothetical protein LEP1GSC055_4008 [Leptospira borgpetersenii str. Brem 307]EMN19379.1 hypothetical protein LEP1GSC056_3070 [Leptospira borgpetersenii str. Brem 328]EMN59252.1 hypothetical protein LEP1GSC090_1448 [Leptospira borgpetersenii serovar Javanica str. MK146]EPG58343.1 hypothetical protein LEP1GSC103_2807 [Leptospira borgpetersenii serovar Javanica str. UI 09931]
MIASTKTPSKSKTRPESILSSVFFPFYPNIISVRIEVKAR